MTSLTWITKLAVISMLCGLMSLVSRAQDETPTKVTNQNRTGDLPFSTSIGTDIEHVDVGSGGLLLNVPIAATKGRGLDYNFALRYDSHYLVAGTRVNQLNGGLYQVWNVELYGWLPFSAQNGGMGWTQNTSRYTSGTQKITCNTPNPSDATTYRAFYIYTDTNGGKHPLAYQWSAAGTCGGIHDLLGPDLTGQGIQAPSSIDPPFYVTSSAGGPILPSSYLGGTSSRGDSNGNGTGDGAGATDTLGRTIVTEQDGTNQTLYKVYDSNGVLQTYTVNFTTVNVSTNFNVVGAYNSTIKEFGATRTVISSIVLPNGRSYQFQHENGTYGAITHIDLPTGASVDYTWATLSDGQRTHRYVASRTLHVNGQNFAWNFSRTGSDHAITETVTDPLGNTQVYTVNDGSITLASFYQGAATGTPLRQYKIDYASDTDPWGADPSFAGIDYEIMQVAMRPIRITTTLDDGRVSKKEFDYETFTYNYHDCHDSSCMTQVTPYTTSRGNVTEIREYDYGTSAPGALLRRTDRTFLHNANASYLTYNIVDKVLQETVYDGAANQAAQTQYEYDNYVSGDNPLASTSGVTEHDYTAHSSTFIYRGNVTRVKRWRNTDGALLTTTYTFDDLGNIRAIKDPLGHTTTYSYTDSWANSSCLPPAGTTAQAYVAQVTNALSQNIQVTQFPCTGLVQSHKDQNDISAGRAGTIYLYDLFGRSTQKNLPDGGQTSVSYNDVPPVSATTTTKITSSLNLVSSMIKDDLGRLKQTQLTSDPQGTVYGDTTYDGLGRKSTFSNPYRSTTDVTYGITTSQYDPLNRVTILIPPDGTSSTNNVATTYSGPCTTVTDEAGKKRKSCSDALGRLIEVDEPGGGSAGTAGYGSGTVNGGEQTIAAINAVAGTGSGTVNGIEQSKSATPATQATGSVTISGTEQSTININGHLVYDAGNVSITVNGHTDSVTYARSSTSTSIATALVNTINADTSSPVTAVASGSSVNLTSKASGAASNYPLSESATTNDPTDFGSGSFSAFSPNSTLTGGKDAVSTVYDSGTVWITVNGFQASASYGQGSTTSALASALANVFNTNSSSPVTASASGATVSLTARQTGASSNYSLSSGSSTSQPGTFSQPSFTASVSGSSLTGGKDGVAAIYDSGSVWMTVNGFQASATYGQGSTTSILASALANVFNTNTSSPVTASVSGSTVNVLAKQTGAGSNYSLSSGSSTSQPGSFSSPSFTVSVSAASLTGGTDPTSPSLSTPAVTAYSYDALNNLTSALQSGSRQRTFTYNSLSQLLTATNPESGTITYTYNDDGTLKTKTDARGITTTHSYDALHRLTSDTYSDATPSVSYWYDGATPSGCSPSLATTNGIGRRTAMCDTAGWEAWSYDSMGRPLTDRRTTNSVTKDTSYTYNLDGSVATLTYPSGRTITYTPNAAARIVSAVDTANAISYATGALYSPAGSLSSLQTGGSLVSTFYYNNRLQPCRISVTSAGVAPAQCSDAANIGNVLDFSYAFNAGTANNGDVVQIVNNRNTARTQAFTYDEWNRIKTAATQATTGTYAWGLQFSYDIWGNLLSSSVTQGSVPTLSLAVNTANQVLGYSYDLAGNMLNDATNSYTWDAESRMKTAAGVSYSYDGDGRRVSKSSGKLYWYGAGNDVLDETDGSGNLTAEYVFFDGKRIARRDASNNVVFYFADHLGSSRVVANSSGAILDDSDFYPFGGERSVTSSSGNNYKFAGKERDAETGNDDFGARYYSSNLGRWLSADWSAIPAPIPYANLTNPQTLNLYAMVGDNPETFADLDGHINANGGRDPNQVTDQFICGNNPDICKNEDDPPPPAQKQAQNPAWSSLSVTQQDLVGDADTWADLSAAQQANFAAITHALEKTTLSDGTSAIDQVHTVTSVGEQDIAVTWEAGAQQAFKGSGFVPRWGLGHEGESGMIGKPTPQGIKGSFWQAEGMHVLFNDADKGVTGHVHMDYRSGLAHYDKVPNSDIRSVGPGKWNNYQTYKEWYGPIPGYTP